MNFRRFAVSLVLAFVAVTLCGALALAAEDVDPPRVTMNHVTRASLIDWRAKYEVTEDDINRGVEIPFQYRSPAMYFIYLNIYNESSTEAEGPQSGELEVATHAPSYVEYYDAATMANQNGTQVIPAAGLRFSMWPYPGEWTDYYTGVNEGYRAEFLNSGDISSETALSAAPFTLTFGEREPVAGKLGTIRIPGEVIKSGCAPYVSLDIVEGVLTNVHWRFVNPADVAANPGAVPAALKRSAENDVREMVRMTVRMNGGSSQIRKNIRKRFSEGESFEGVVDYSSDKIQAKDIFHVELTFEYSDYINENRTSDTRYAWRFYNGMPAPDDNDGQPHPEKPTREEVDAAKTAAAKDLATAPIEVVAAEGTNISTGTDVTYADDGGMDVRTSSVIAIKQTVKSGGAVVLTAADKLVMPVNSKSLSGAELPIPEDFPALAQNYHVYKFFEAGGYVDLLATYKETLFGYDTETGVTMKAAVMVIDGKPDPKESDVVKPGGFENVGVKFVADSKVLYIWDGNENSEVSDPIALVKAEGNNYGGSSGCATAGMILPFALFAAVAILKKRD